MTTAQKVIKYLATAFAVFLIVTIISGILTAIYALSAVLGLRKNSKSETTTTETIQAQMSEVYVWSGEISILEIETKSSNITIKTGDSFRAESNSEDIVANQSNHVLQLVEKNYNLFKRNDNEIVIYVPANYEFEKVKINAGAGKVKIENLTTKVLDFELGAGETYIENLKVEDECTIEGGAGEMTITSGEINKLDLDMGIGEVKITAKLTGKSDIDAGVGSLKINVDGEKENYLLKVDKGLGSIKIDGKEAEDDHVYGEGVNVLEVDGGVGEIIVNFI